MSDRASSNVIISQELRNIGFLEGADKYAPMRQRQRVEITRLASSF